MSCRVEEKGVAEINCKATDLQNMDFSHIPRLKASLIHKWKIFQMTLDEQHKMLCPKIHFCLFVCFSTELVKLQPYRSVKIQISPDVFGTDTMMLKKMNFLNNCFWSSMV